LSATPERAGDEEGTNFIFDYFGGVVHEYGLDDAIRDRVLVPYTYHPFFVHLTGEEQESWDAVSEDIARLTAISHEPNPPAWVQGRLDLLRIQRARIAKAAEGKIPRAVDLVKQRFVKDSDQRWLIYCEGLEQLHELRSALRSEGMRSWEFHSQMQGDREATLEAFSDSGGVVVAIKCLDEGVDIPAASDALILASSRNPREFIQRRGRVLRRAQNKSLAHIYDAIVLPASGSPRSSSNALVVGELARALTFSRSSLGSSAATLLENKWVELGYEMGELETLAQAGFEPGEDNAEPT
jgi:superfamily II DNA or RNA helicase